MDFELGPEAEALRRRLRELIDEQLPPEFLGAFTEEPEDLETTRRFCKLLAAQRLLAPTWPEEFGGGDRSVWEQTVLREEMWAHHEPRGPQYMSLNWVGPAILRFGTDEQKRFHLPKMAGGEVLWCQGFSEPDAGSDLASLQTAARRDGDGWIVHGQKIWTSYAQVAEWCVLAARTGPPESRRDGISLFLVPMDRAGIEVRPIRSMLGPYHLNEMFIDGLRVERHELLGEEHRGWSVIRGVLAYERVGIARYARADRLLQAVLAAVGGMAALPAGLRSRYARALVHNRVARLAAYEVVGAQAAGGGDDGAAAAARIAAVTGDQEASEVLVEAIGSAVFDSAPVLGTLLQAAVEDYWRYSRSATVSAGSVDIQRTIVARAVLHGAA